MVMDWDGKVRNQPLELVVCLVVRVRFGIANNFYQEASEPMHFRRRNQLNIVNHRSTVKIAKAEQTITRLI